MVMKQPGDFLEDLWQIQQAASGLICHVSLPFLANDGERAIIYHYEISNNVVCGTSKGSDQPAHMRSLIRAFASHLNTL